MDPWIGIGGILLNFLAGIGDRVFGQAQADQGRDELRRLRGDFQTESTDPNTGERTIQNQGVTSAIHERLGKDLTDILGTIGASKDQQTATIDNFDSSRPSLGNLTANLGQDLLYGTNTAGKTEGSVGGSGGGVFGREQTRQSNLEKAGGSIISGAEQRYGDTITMLQRVMGQTGSYINQSIDSAKRGLADITNRVTGSIDWAKENLATGLSEYSGAALAATGEAVAGVDSGYRQTLASIEESASNLPPQQVAMLKAQAKDQRTATLVKVGRDARAQDANNLAVIRKNLSDTVAGAMAAGNNAIASAWQNLSGTITAGAKIAGEVGTTAANIQASASASLGNLSKDVATLVDSGARFMSDIMGQYGQSVANNIVQSTAQDIDYAKWVADTKRSIIDNAAMNEVNIKSAVSQAAVNALAMDADITKAIAGSYFNWQTMMIPMSTITQNGFQDFMQWQQLKIAQDASRPQTDWGGMIGGIASGGLSLVGSAISK